jgi:protein-disulfide isomerase/uncharacterized membrane protein
MKKTIYGILIASIAGAVISTLLMLIHYYPDSAVSSAVCSQSMPGSCESAAASPYSVLFGIPLAAYGLFFYLFLSFIILTADYAADDYPETAVAAVLPMSLFAAAADIPLAVIMINIGEFCSYCAATYLINIIIFILSFMSVKNSAALNNSGIPAYYSALIKKLQADNSHIRAAKSLFIIFSVLLAFSVISTDRVMNTRTAESRIDRDKAGAFVKRFMSQPPEDIQLPENPITFGDEAAPVEIAVFTDFLCSACYQFYTIEKKLLKKYAGKIKVHNYHYPLDAECNATMKNSIYPGSCAAARAVTAAADMGITEQYLVNHFSVYGEYKKNGYNEIYAASNAGGLTDRDSFIKKMKSRETEERIASHIEASRKLKIEATPTIFIASRRIVGIPPVEFIEALINHQLKK